MSFALYKAFTTRGLRYRVIANSQTVVVGGMLVDKSTGVQASNASTDYELGYVTAVVTPNKVSLESASVNLADYDGSWTASSKTYVASASNTTAVTGKMVMVEYMPVREGDQLYANLSAAKGTTVGSNLESYYLSISTTDSRLLLETSASTTSTAAQFAIRDPLISNTDTTLIVIEVLLRQTNV